MTNIISADNKVRLLKKINATKFLWLYLSGCHMPVSFLLYSRRAKVNSCMKTRQSSCVWYESLCISWSVPLFSWLIKNIEGNITCLGVTQKNLILYMLKKLLPIFQSSSAAQWMCSVDSAKSDPECQLKGGNRSDHHLLGKAYLRFNL